MNQAQFIDAVDAELPLTVHSRENYVVCVPLSQSAVPPEMEHCSVIARCQNATCFIQGPLCSGCLWLQRQTARARGSQSTNDKVMCSPSEQPRGKGRLTPGRKKGKAWTHCLRDHPAPMAVVGTMNSGYQHTVHRVCNYGRSA